MRIIQDASVLKISTESLEGGAFSIKNNGATNIAAVDIAITVEDFSGTLIDAANWSITNPNPSQGALNGDTFELGTVNAQATAIIDFELTIGTVSAFPSQFRVKATYTGSDDNVGNDIGTKTFNVLLNSEVNPV